MLTTQDKTITVRAPEFAQYERVLLDYNQIRITQIINRWYELDKDTWWYQCSGNDTRTYPESAFSHIPEDFNLEEFLENY